MATIKASFLVTIVAAWASLGTVASAGQSASALPSQRCESAIVAASAADAAHDDTFVERPIVCESPSDAQQGVWPAPLQPYDGFGTGGDPIVVKRSGNEFFGAVASLAHVFFAFNVAAAHHLIPHFAHHHRAVPPPDSLPNF
jgi:hypothetical protein